MENDKHKAVDGVPPQRINYEPVYVPSGPLNKVPRCKLHGAIVERNKRSYVVISRGGNIMIRPINSQGSGDLQLAGDLGTLFAYGVQTNP